MNITIVVIALAWAVIYNNFFGWNFSSKTPEEIICDGIFAILMSMSITGYKK